MTEAERSVRQVDEKALRGLLAALQGGVAQSGVAGRSPVPGEWQGWRITPIAGGANNLLYRATGPHADLAIKFTIRDARDRAGREYAALCALQRAGLELAPRPVLLDRLSYPQPVVVQTWLAGEVKQTLPDGDGEGDGEWTALLRHHLAVHALTPERTGAALAEAVMDASSAAAAWRLVEEQAERIPGPARPASLCELLERGAAAHFPTWATPPLTLRRGDPNLNNFIWQRGACLSVDWEDSGWGDPAFDIADLMVHPTYLSVPAARWEWLVDAYSQSAGPAAADRIWTYYGILLVWWVARLARRLYELPRGLDERLVAPPSGWQADTQARYEQYLELVNTFR